MRQRAALALVALLAATPAAGAIPRRLAVVVGVEDYGALGPILPVEGARDDATRVAEALERAGFDQVRLYTDASATRAHLEAVLAREIGPRTGPQDLFLLYFVGHGIGGDFGEPRLLLHDTDPDAVEHTSWPVADLAAHVRASVHAGRIVVATDAARCGSLGGLALLGPQPEHWPSLGRSTLVIASAGPREVGTPRAFSAAFVEALGAAADTSGDGRVTSGEVLRHLVRAVPQATGQSQHPAVQPDHDPSFEVARVPGSRSAESDGSRIEKVKFVFRAGISPTVRCEGSDPVVCDPSCVLWNVVPGSCEASAVLGGVRRSVTLQVRDRGGWICAESGTRLACEEAR
ncbi:MAG: caspase family protein [Deltaproteobacteria bacterium]|nr:caspase family protein [Deltaproteobacteria bacterium]